MRIVIIHPFIHPGFCSSIALLKTATGTPSIRYMTSNCQWTLNRPLDVPNDPIINESNPTESMSGFTLVTYLVKRSVGPISRYVSRYVGRYVCMYVCMYVCRYVNERLLTCKWLLHNWELFIVLLFVNRL
jgi:hypothetical protein